MAVLIGTLFFIGTFKESSLEDCDTGFCPIIGNYNPCTGSNVVQAEVNYAIRPPQYCVLRGKETEEEIALLTGGSEQELEEEEDENDFEITSD